MTEQSSAAQASLCESAHSVRPVWIVRQVDVLVRAQEVTAPVCATRRIHGPEQPHFALGDTPYLRLVATGVFGLPRIANGRR